MQQEFCCYSATLISSELPLMCSSSSAVDCPALEKPSDGCVEVPSLKQGTNATYSCNEGYNMMGDSSRTCDSTATWTGNAPTCQSTSLFSQFRLIHSYIYKQALPKWYNYSKIPSKKVCVLYTFTPIDLFYTRRYTFLCCAILLINEAHFLINHYYLNSC